MSDQIIGPSITIDDTNSRLIDYLGNGNYSEGSEFSIRVNDDINNVKTFKVLEESTNLLTGFHGAIIQEG